MSQSKILFVFTAESYHRESAPVINEFVSHGWKVYLLLGFNSEHTQHIVAENEAIGVEVIVASDVVGYGLGEALSKEKRGQTGAPVKTSVAWKVLSTVRNGLRKTGLVRLLFFPGYLIRSFQKRIYATNFINLIDPKVVVMGSFHSVGQLDNGIVRACLKKNIRLYCLPNSPYLGSITLRVGRLNHLEHGMVTDVIRSNYDILNRVLAFFFRSWTRELPDGSRVFYWDPLRVLAARWTGMMINRLWLKPSLDFKKVFVHSEFSRNLLVADLYPRDRIVVSGPPLLDKVLEKASNSEHRAALFSYIKLQDRDPFILFNVEPSAEHRYCDWDRHWKNFHETLGVVSRCGIPVVLSLHPLCSYEMYKFAEVKYGVLISTKYRIHDLYPYCFLSVSFPCSTNLLAETFEKPLVIYDHFDLFDRDEETRILNTIPNSSIVSTEVALYDAIQIILKNKKYYNEGAQQKTQQASKVITETIISDS